MLKNEIHPNRGLYYGDGLFETVRYDARCGGYVGLDGHLRRLRAGAKLLGLTLPKGMFTGFVPVTEKAAVRLTVWRRGGPPYLSSETQVQTMLESRPVVGEREPIRLRLSSYRLSPSAYSRFKTLNGLTYVLAARETGPEAALLLSTKTKAGVPMPACAAGYNVFFFKKRQLVTPPLGTGCIAGTMRRFILRHGLEVGLETVVSPIKYDEIFEFDGAFLTNAVTLFRPVVSLNGREFSINDDGPWSQLEKLLVLHGRLSVDARTYPED